MSPPDAVGQGGGMLIVRGSPTLFNCQFIGNRAVVSEAAQGDEHAQFSSDVLSSGGIYNAGGSPVVMGCTFVANDTPFGSGGGMANSGGGNPIVANCTFFKNEGNNGGGIFNDAGGIFRTDSTITSLTVSNSILWGNSPNQIDIPPTDSVTFSDVQGGFPGLGNFDEDPRFVDPDGADDILGTQDDNLRLQTESPAIDAGDNSAVPADTADLDGDCDITEPTPLDLDRNPRFVDDPDVTPDPGNGTPPIVDLGAYEFQRFPPPPPPIIDCIPTVSQWGLVVLTLCLVTAGCLVLRRRRGLEARAERAFDCGDQAA